MIHGDGGSSPFPSLNAGLSQLQLNTALTGEEDIVLFEYTQMISHMIRSQPTELDNAYQCLYISGDFRR